MGTKGIRDPYIFRKQDGKFGIVATDMLGTIGEIRASIFIIGNPRI